MNRKRLSFIISYDGRTGGKNHGKRLPEYLNLTYIEVDAGLSSQATLLGRTAQTVESIYVSSALLSRIGKSRIEQAEPEKRVQLSLF